MGVEELVETPDGRVLHTMVAGEGPDLVVLEAGLGFGGHYWAPVHERLARRVRVVAYDRAGLGDSSPDPHPRDLDRLEADLGVLLDAYPHRRLVLVGHSWGGPVVRLAAARRLDSARPITGVVLVDASDEHAPGYFARQAALGDAVQAATLPTLARVGLMRALIAVAARGLEPVHRRGLLDSSTTVAAARAAVEENRHVRPGLRALLDRPLPLPDVPVTVISGRRHGRLDAGLRRQLNRAHAVTAERHGGRLVFAERSGHLIPLSEPELIAREVLAMVEPAPEPA
ncbi:hydrolase or acyltransferase of alpha/beta superfamily protein [Mobilicoccus caccae]|uniref:Hydrolase or acyltransferase of alpha/beta superfamily protein n=2 Tax=Mobilicoccus caccae TaxID=1859295 RepID=A0ABQ6IMX8_9MICO|nr:hydrolase or acyltransferase of alpha/beta superfamily protein [Mobilicoccus caccae]